MSENFKNDLKFYVLMTLMSPFWVYFRVRDVIRKYRSGLKNIRTGTESEGNL